MLRSARSQKGFLHYSAQVSVRRLGRTNRQDGSDGRRFMLEPHQVAESACVGRHHRRPEAPRTRTDERESNHAWEKPIAQNIACVPGPQVIPGPEAFPRRVGGEEGSYGQTWLAWSRASSAERLWQHASEPLHACFAPPASLIISGRDGRTWLHLGGALLGRLWKVDEMVRPTPAWESFENTLNSEL